MQLLFTTNLLYYSPLLLGVAAYITLLKKDGETRIRNVIFWFIASLSIPWLLFGWNSLIKTDKDARIFLWSLAVYLIVWLSWIILFNQGEKYVKASRVMLFLGLALAYLMLFSNLLSDFLNIKTDWLASHDMEIIMGVSLFGMFWVLGIWAKNYEIVLFKDDQFDSRKHSQ